MLLFYDCLDDYWYSYFLILYCNISRYYIIIIVIIIIIIIIIIVIIIIVIIIIIIIVIIISIICWDRGCHKYLSNHKSRLAFIWLDVCGIHLMLSLSLLSPVIIITIIIAIVP